LQKPCHHSGSAGEKGLALVTLGNPLRGDDGVAARLCDSLPDSVMENVCRFDLESNSSQLADCLSGHQAAIVLDATSCGATTGTITLVDLNAAMQRTSALAIESSHGLSLLDELRLARASAFPLPSKMIMFGVEVADVNWGSGVSHELSQELPALSSRLALLIMKVMETLTKNA
jgi:hydrogenase maturation protease